MLFLVFGVVITSRPCSRVDLQSIILDGMIENAAELGMNILQISKRFSAWEQEAEKYRNGEITKEEYDRWRYTYPEVDAQRTRDALDTLRKEKTE